MTIFGFRILRERQYQADLIAAHCEEYESHHRHRRQLERKIAELDMQRGWWRMQYEELRRRPRIIRIRTNLLGTIRLEVE